MARYLLHSPPVYLPKSLLRSSRTIISSSSSSSFGNNTFINNSSIINSNNNNNNISLSNSFNNLSVPQAPLSKRPLNFIPTLR